MLFVAVFPLDQNASLAVYTDMRLTAILSFFLLLTGSTLTEEQKITHLLNRAGFGPRPGQVELVKKIGIEKYIDQQLHPELIDDGAMQTRLATLPSITMSTSEILSKYARPRQNMAGAEPPRKLLEELTSQKIIRAVHSERQLQEVLSDLWFNHLMILWG